MYKFLVALAEMFSAFAAKLHDMSANEPEFVTAWDVRNIIKELPDSLDRTDVIDIVRDAIDNGDIITKQECDDDSIIYAEDVKDFESAVSREIGDYDFDEMFANYEFKRQVTAMILTYAEQVGADTRGIYMQGEVWDLQRYLGTRKEKWDAWEAEEASRVKSRIIREFKRDNAIQETVDHPCPPCPTHTLHINVNKSDEDVKI